MDLVEFWSSVPEAAGWSHADKIKLFAWYLHYHGGVATFASTDIRKCFDKLNVAPPTSVGPFLSAMVSRNDALKNAAGYRLEARVRDAFSQRFGQRLASIQVHQLLSDLPAKMPTETDKAFLEETLICFKAGAFRATVVMAWNLAFDHFCVWLFSKHLATFNAELAKRFPKLSPVLSRDGFTEMKESQVIDVSRSAGIISGGVLKVLDEKLKKRNLAAHPSGILTTQITAEEVITDLMNNVVLKLT